tara:strand:- start:358 stop:510 length:153 start_codon:yes stop_codon:yes gene_type:complete
MEKRAFKYVILFILELAILFFNLTAKMVIKGHKTFTPKRENAVITLISEF